MNRLLIVSIGGSAARYLPAGWIASRSSFPLGTLSVNLLGAFLVGTVMEIAVNTDAYRRICV